ncbi:hypothetical protein H0H93_015868, partial [Arthromyces matolae]
MGAGEAIFAHFDRSFPEGKLDKWSIGDRGRGSDRLTMDASNRVFTSAQDAGDNDFHVGFDKDSDPDGALEKIAESGYKHTDDNQVYFSAAADDNAGTMRQ